MRHHLFAADDEGLIDSKSIDLFWASSVSSPGPFKLKRLPKLAYVAIDISKARFSHTLHDAEESQDLHI